MKYIISILLLLPFSLFAQDSGNDIRKFDLGLNFGLNVSNVLAKNKDTLSSEDFSPRITGHIGLKLMYQPKPFLAVRSGFNFNIRGYKIKDEVFFNSSTPSEIETVFSFVYLDIPLVAQFNLATDVENGGFF